MDLAEGPRWILGSNEGDSVNANRHKRTAKTFTTELRAQSPAVPRQNAIRAGKHYSRTGLDRRQARVGSEFRQIVLFHKANEARERLGGNRQDMALPQFSQENSNGRGSAVRPRDRSDDAIRPISAWR